MYHIKKKIIIFDVINNVMNQQAPAILPMLVTTLSNKANEWPSNNGQEKLIIQLLYH
jgi:hypothetical protein